MPKLLAKEHHENTMCAVEEAGSIKYLRQIKESGNKFLTCKISLLAPYYPFYFYCIICYPFTCVPQQENNVAYYGTGIILLCDFLDRSLPILESIYDISFHLTNTQNQFSYYACIAIDVEGKNRNC